MEESDPDVCKSTSIPADENAGVKRFRGISMYEGPKLGGESGSERWRGKKLLMWDSLSPHLDWPNWLLRCRCALKSGAATLNSPFWSGRHKSVTFEMSRLLTPATHDRARHSCLMHTTSVCSCQSVMLLRRTNESNWFVNVFLRWNGRTIPASPAYDRLK